MVASSSLPYVIVKVHASGWTETLIHVCKLFRIVHLLFDYCFVLSEHLFDI